MEFFSQRIRELARELGLSDSEVARRVGIDERRYAYYATGEREPNLATLVQICAVLGTSPDVVLLRDRAKRDQRGTRERLIARVNALVETLNDEDLELAVGQLAYLSNFRAKTHQRPKVRKRSAEPKKTK